MASRLQPAAQKESLPPLKGLGLIINAHPGLNHPNSRKSGASRGPRSRPGLSLFRPSGSGCWCPTLVRRLCGQGGETAHSMRPSAPRQRTNVAVLRIRISLVAEKTEPDRAELKLAQDVSPG